MEITIIGAGNMGRGIGLLHITLQGKLGSNWMSAVKFVS